jgi:hypothetical protein
MSTKSTARGIAGSLRRLGATAAVVAGIAGFVAMGAAPASAAASAQGNVPEKACHNMQRAGVPLDVFVKHGCLVDVPDEGEITAGSIFG